MKRLSLQWRITLMTVLLIGITCVAMNLLLCSSGVYYMDTIADSLQGGSTVILNEGGVASFDPQLIAPNEELTIVVDGAQGRFRTTNWYITAAVTILSGILAYFVSGRALKPLRSFASQVEKVQLNNLADMRIDEDVLPEFRQLSRSFNQMLERLNNAFAAQRQFTGNAAHELRTPLALMQAQLELFSAEHPDVRPETAEFLTLLREQTERLNCRNSGSTSSSIFISARLFSCTFSTCEAKLRRGLSARPLTKYAKTPLSTVTAAVIYQFVVQKDVFAPCMTMVTSSFIPASSGSKNAGSPSTAALP